MAYDFTTSAPSLPRINVAIASPSDVAPERAAVLRVLNRWNAHNHHAVLIALASESASVPTLGAHPQDILNEQIIHRSQLLVAILWSRLGTPTPNAPSGTVDEINEFIRVKGPQRVMLYFCTRAVPQDQIDPAELARLYQFKDEMRTRGLYQQYASVDEFERLLYEHLGPKVADFVSNRLPPPSATAIHRDAGEFGTSLEAIATTFATRMREFGDRPSGRDKYLALGAKVYDGAAAALDSFIAYSPGSVRPEDRVVVQTISARLKRLAATYEDYTKRPWPDFWNAGHAISRELSDHVEHVNRTGKR
jgi:hypothetical protein